MKSRRYTNFSTSFSKFLSKSSCAHDRSYGKMQAAKMRTYESWCSSISMANIVSSGANTKKSMSYSRQCIKHTQTHRHMEHIQRQTARYLYLVYSIHCTWNAHRCRLNQIELLDIIHKKCARMWTVKHTHTHTKNEPLISGTPKQSSLCGTCKKLYVWCVLASLRFG